jgi:hypothetical protein
MSVHTTPEERDQSATEASKEPRADKRPADAAPRQSWAERIGLSFRDLEWGRTAITALVMAATWCALFLGASVLQIVAGVVPVLAGLYLGRRVKGNYLGHGLALGLLGFLFGLLIVIAYGALVGAGLVPAPLLQLNPDGPPSPAGPGDLLFIYSTFSIFALIPFPAFGTVMAGRAEERNRQLRQEVAERGGQLEKPGVVRTLEDLQGLSLPQLGSFVANLYKKQGFTFKDYRFVDKDKHLDIVLAYNDAPYLLRLSVADKVRPGTIEGLAQEMKRRGILRGVAITSTEFTPDAIKAAAGKNNLVAIDGQTLFDMSES